MHDALVIFYFSLIRKVRGWYIGFGWVFLHDFKARKVLLHIYVNIFVCVVSSSEWGRLPKFGVYAHAPSHIWIHIYTCTPHTNTCKKARGCGVLWSAVFWTRHVSCSTTHRSCADLRKTQSRSSSQISAWMRKGPCLVGVGKLERWIWSKDTVLLVWNYQRR